MASGEQLLREHYDDPYHRGPCEVATHAASARCNESGCQLAYELSVDAGGTVHQAWFDGEGCPTCEALASLLAGYVEGKSLEQLRLLNIAGLSEPLGLSSEMQWLDQPCASLAVTVLHKAMAHPLDQVDGDLADGTSFGGPSLREEC